MSILSLPPALERVLSKHKVRPDQSSLEHDRPFMQTQPPPAPGRPIPGKKHYELVAVTDLLAMQQFIPQWETLADQAIEPNVFYEHWALIPALQLYGKGCVTTAFVVEKDPNAGMRSRLIGAFPLEFCRQFRHLPLTCARMWKHPHCYLANPLIARGFEAACGFLHIIPGLC